MRIITINDYNDLVETQPTVLVLGYFDGLHLGHKALFDKAREIAEQKNLSISVLTFHESPKLTFARFSPELLLHLAYPEKRYSKFEEFGVDYLYLTNFTSDFAKTSSDDFIRNYVEQLQAKDIVVGFDYQFGHNKTDSDYLSRNTTATVHTVGEVQFDGGKISSSRIREAVANGDIGLTNKLLGYTFTTRGIVVHGDARGRTIGYPTANLAPIDRTYLPSDGVYVTDVCVKGKMYRAMTSIGQNVTFGGTELRLEAHIFDFEGDIYGEEIEIFWLCKIRDMVKFSGIDDLITQLEKDEQFSKNWT